MPKTVYIAGPISGCRNYEEVFAAAAAKLKAAGFIPVNPAALPGRGFSYEAYLRMSGAMLRECAAVYFLPGWEKSNGACQEYAYAIENGLDIICEHELEERKETSYA